MLRLQLESQFDRLTRLTQLTPGRRSRTSIALPLAAVGVGAGLGGALVALMFDPRQGARRRHMMGGRLAGMVRRAASRAEREGRYASHTGQLELDDQTLTDKVMSEVFGGADVPKSTIDVNSEHGVVVLRGQARTPKLIDEIEAKVRAVDGVRDVRNLLHLPKTPAQSNKGPRRPAQP
ncbi:MAG TPA: BON domain-containing protein [Candidatus Dormibacteraeota bacterium]